MIQFKYLIPDFILPDPWIIKEWLINVILKEKKIPGELSFIFCHDAYLLEMNKNFLKHDYYTDVITFPTSIKKDIISGEIYLSIERIRENAIHSQVQFKNELLRVIVHGVLHLLGYNDHSADDITLMRSKEDNYLLLLPEF